MRVVVKIGTSTLAHATGHLNIRRVASLCRVISDIKNAGHEVILVSSGAIGMGVGKLGLRQRPKDIPTKQAAAAVGQCELMYIYDKLFSEYHHTVAQLLITGEDVASEKRHQNFSNTLNRLLELGALPIINENDTVATEEIVIGDNDTLAAIVAKSVNARLLVLLSDIDGLYTADPRKEPDAALIPTVAVLDDSIRALAGVSGSEQGTGGMITKLQAAEICMGCGCNAAGVVGCRIIDSRRERLARHTELYEKHLGGAPVHKLAEEYYLSAKTIYKILASMRQA